MIPIARGLATIGPYQVLEDLGVVPWGTAYRAVDSRSDREVLLKVVPPALQAADGEGVPWELLLAETAALARIYHPGIPTLYEIAELEGAMLLAFEPVEGRTLAEALAGGERPDRGRLAEWGAQLLEILGEAHAQGVFHRRLREEEIVLTPEGRLVLTGFGLTQLEFEPAVVLPSSAAAAGRGAATQQTDLAALGDLLLRLASHARLASGDPILAVLARATTLDPADRFADSGQMAEALRLARQAGSPPPLPAAAAAPAPADAGSGEGDRLRALLLLAAALLLFLLVVATGWLLLEGGSPESGGSPSAARPAGPAAATLPDPVR